MRNRTFVKYEHPEEVEDDFGFLFLLESSPPFVRQISVMQRNEAKEGVTPAKDAGPGKLKIGDILRTILFFKSARASICGHLLPFLVLRPSVSPQAICESRFQGYRLLARSLSVRLLACVRASALKVVTLNEEQQGGSDCFAS